MFMWPTYYQPQGIAQMTGLPCYPVNGIEGTKPYTPGPNQSIILMDMEASVFYVKTSDASGMPLPIRIFEFNERTNKEQTEKTGSEFITREEFEDRINSLSKRVHKPRKRYNKTGVDNG